MINYAEATITEYEEFIENNKPMPIKRLEFWENIPTCYIRKFMEYDYVLKQKEKINYQSK